MCAVTCSRRIVVYLTCQCVCWHVTTRVREPAMLCQQVIRYLNTQYSRSHHSYSYDTCTPPTWLDVHGGLVSCVAASRLLNPKKQLCLPTSSAARECSGPSKSVPHEQSWGLLAGLASDAPPATRLCTLRFTVCIVDTVDSTIRCQNSHCFLCSRAILLRGGAFCLREMSTLPVAGTIESTTQ